ncbi:MAG: N-acetylmuramoyl-L-alanine amidase [Nitrosomonas sp.]|nr:N-acetylmuramoyl-L-alanine amidase [Nitrosomonas sp.]MDP1950924.1 N-acetylmuramoyl-L-alanine amidase [Nitrosomonas sp.]
MSETLARSREFLITTTRGSSLFSASTLFLALWLMVTSLSLTLISKTALAENTVNAVRVWTSPDFTRFTFESNLTIQYSLSLLDNPGRVVIDLKNVAATPALRSLPGQVKATDPLIQTVRIGHFKPHILRLVLDLKAAVVPQAYMLDPTENFGHRLIVDVYSANKAAEFDSLDNLVASLLQPKSIENNSNSSQPQVIQTTPKVKPELNQPKVIQNTPKSPKTKPEPSRMIVIAIDPGHGGKDPGAIGRQGTHEKDITLAIAKKLKAIIDKESNMRAVLTREGDYYISLPMRRAKARSLNADLFVSVHADAAHRKTARGSSVYTLSEHGATSAAASWLAKKENSVDSDLMGGIDMITKSRDVKEMLIDLSLSATIIDSVKLGQHVLSEIGDVNHLHKKNVEQAPFAVLKSPDIPSILVETAFLSNPQDEQKLNTKAYQRKMASALFTGIKSYFATSPALARTRVAQLE